MIRSSLPVAAALAALVLSGCGGQADGAGQDDGAGQGGGGLTVVTGFYPLEYAVEQVVADVPGVVVETLTAPGTDAHDVELSPRQVAGVRDADLVVYSSGMQAAVDAAVAGQASGHSLDVTTAVDLIGTGEPHAGHEQEGHDHDADQHEGHEQEGHDHDADQHDGHDHGSVDPHFWLDPERYAAAGSAIAEELATIDPGHAETYRANAQQFASTLGELDAEFRQTLASCERDTLVTTHEAFGHLADRYGLHQIGITGITPGVEATPARMAEVVDVVERLDIPAVYAQSTIGGDLAEVIGRETGTQVLVLDPIEGITSDSAGDDYLEVMRANLAALRQGQGCS